MAIRTVVTRGFGNGTFNGTIGTVVLRGFGAGVVVLIEVVAGAVLSDSIVGAITKDTCTLDVAKDAVPGDTIVGLPS